jgi:LysM repeat protein
MKRARKIGTLVIVLGLLSTVIGVLPVAAQSQFPTGGFWFGEYFDARWPNARPVYTRNDLAIDFDWGTGSPNAAVPIDNFSVRWTRTVEFTGGTFRFYALHDDGVLVWVDEQLIINQWYDQPAYVTDQQGAPIPVYHYGTLTLGPGPHRIKVEYYEHGKNATIQVGWTPVQPVSVPLDSPPSTLQTANIHIVRPGEWLYKIARAYNTSPQSIIAANGLTTLQLEPGQKLTIPAAATSSQDGDPPTTASGKCLAAYSVRPGDNLFRIALRFGTTVTVLAAENNLQAPYTLRAGQSLCIP